MSPLRQIYEFSNDEQNDPIDLFDNRSKSLAAPDELSEFRE